MQVNLFENFSLHQPFFVVHASDKDKNEVFIFLNFITFIFALILFILLTIKQFKTRFFRTLD